MMMFNHEGQRIKEIVHRLMTKARRENLFSVMMSVPTNLFLLQYRSCNAIKHRMAWQVIPAVYFVIFLENPKSIDQTNKKKGQIKSLQMFVYL